MAAPHTTEHPVGNPLAPGTASSLARGILDSVAHSMDGKNDPLEVALIVLLAEGHLLLEDVPGVGKTMMARSVAKTIGGTVHRIQFTPDLLPSDISGITTFNSTTNTFEFQPGPIFANIVIADEINRASPKTQSALLEAMEEAQVSIDGVTYHLPRPFAVIATQNPVDMEGTFPLPEAQRDRFMARISLGYPHFDAEVAMLHERIQGNPLDAIQEVCTIEEFQTLQQAVQGVYVAPAIEHYIVTLVQNTRKHAALRLGASPRASIQLAKAAKARALLHSREYALPDDVVSLAPAVLSHRLLPARARFGAQADEVTSSVIQEVLAQTPVPTAPTPS